VLFVLAMVATTATTLALPAFASFDHRFTVAIGDPRIKAVGTDKYRAKARLLNPRDRHERVGRLWGVRKALSGRKSYYRLRFHLSGLIGGFGSIRVHGNFGGHDRRLRVVGGNHDFNGVVGHVDFGDRGLAHFVLKRTFIEPHHAPPPPRSVAGA